jgi:predicted transcriptional regulator
MQRTVELPEEQVRELEQLAAREHRSLDEVVQFAVGDYLARRRTWADWASAGRPWSQIFGRACLRM